MMRNNQTSDRGSNPSKRRATPIPVQPPRIPTPMPATNNNNPHSRVVVGGCNKDQLQAQKKQYESQSTSSTKNSTKYLDNDVKTSWINPRLISKIDMEAVISSEYVPPVQRANLYNRNNFQSNQVQHQIHQQQQQHQQQNKRERTAVIQQQQEWETPASTCSGSNRTTSTTSGGKCQQMARQSSIILSVASMPHTDAVLPCKRAERTAAKHVVSMKHAARHKSHYGTPKPVKHSLNCSDKVTSNSGKQHSSNFNSSSASNNQHKTLPNTTLPVAYSDSVSVSSYASAAGPVADRASASGVFGLYSESKYTYSVNRLPGNPAQTSAAAAFFARAAQKLNLSASPHRRKRHSSGDEEYTTGGFSGVIQRTPPPVPPALLRRIGVKEITGVGKVKVMLRVSTPTNGSPQEGSATGSFFSLDKRKKQVTLFDPAVCSGVSAPEDRRVGVAAPKMFAFDAIFSQDDSQTEVCSSALTDVIHAVINGSDGCLFCFGHAGLGKSYTMLGTADNANTLGVIPCAISWLFRGINEQKQKTGARFSVRVSAVEVCGPSNQLKDLLAGHANDSEQSPGVYLRDDPLFGTQLQNHAELRVPTAEKAAWYLDAAIDSRGGTRSSEHRDSHLLFTLHVYQYSVAGKGGVAGGRSRLHLIDLGNSERGKSSGGIPLSGLGNILLAIFNGQKHLPYREHKLTHLLKECLGSLTCHAAMIAHVSPYAQNYTDTLTTVQLASRIHRMRRRKIKFVSAGTGNGSGGSSGEEATRTTGTSSEPDPSSSDLSADTVIYVGPADEGTDGEHPPVYIPSLNSGDNRCVMSKALRGSSAEQRPSKMPTPQKPAAVVATEEKMHKSPSLKNPTTQSCKTSPAHSSTPKSSPIRNPSSKQSIKATPVDPAATTLASKIPVFGNANGCVSTSDEQWIDGPRISRSRVAEARHFMKEACHVKKRETWIDGPMQAGSVTGLNLNHGPNNAGYGYMDSHKKSMIRKWVENQTSQIQRVKHTSPKNEPKTAAVKESFKEMTTFKTCDDPDSLIKEVRPLVEDNWKKHEVEECVIRTGLKISNSKHGGSDVIPECVSPEEKGSTEDETEKDKKDEELDDDDDDDEEEDGMAEIPPALPLIQPLSSREVSMESLNERLKERLRSTVDFESQEDEYDEDMGSDDDEVLEIIEVEEPLEPVPTQDCCLQVTEEDIALCMGYAENPLPEVDQENPLEHPLRILSQENLTVVSTFTDSMSVYTDLERILPRHRYGPNYNMAPDMHSYGMYNEYEDPECPPSVRNGNLHDSTRQKFDQLARLHELYTHRLAKANVTNSPTYIEHKQQQRSLSRCESLSLSDMLYGVGAHETSSIYSEPAYVPQQEKFCENCKVSMSRPATAQNWYTDPTISASTTHLESTDYGFPSLGGRFQRYCHKFPKDNHCSLASLRHPDGASNPNLKEETERIPGNGASLSDHEDDDVEAKLLPSTRTVTGKDHSFRGEEDLPPTLPPPLHLPSSEKVNRRLLSIESGLASMKLNQKQTEGYDSGHDSTPRTSKHSPAAISRRAESGYDSVVRDSESSSIDSDTSRLSHSLHTRRGKCRHKHDRSFCSWLLNPFTCKYIDEPPETHF